MQATGCRCTVTIVRLVETQNWWYPACNLCKKSCLQVSKMQHIGHVHIQVSLHMALHAFSFQLQLIFPLPLEQQHVITYFNSYYIKT